MRIKPGYYVGTSLERYRYYWGWMRETNKIRGSDTVSFKHKYITNPSITTGDAIVNAAQQLTSALCGSIPPPLVKSVIDHLRALTDILMQQKRFTISEKNFHVHRLKQIFLTCELSLPERLPSGSTMINRRWCYSY